MDDPADGPLHLLPGVKELAPDPLQLRVGGVIELVFFGDRGGQQAADILEPVHAGVHVRERGIVVPVGFQVSEYGAGRHGEGLDEREVLDLQYAAFFRQGQERPDVGCAGEVRRLMLERYLLELGYLLHPGPGPGRIEGRDLINELPAH